MPPFENPIAASADEPMATPLAAPAVIISSLTMFFFNSGDLIFPEQWALRMSYSELFHKDYQLLFCIVCSNDNATAPPRLWPITVSISW